MANSFDRMEPRPIQDLYLKIDRLDLGDDQRTALRAVRNLFIEEKALEGDPIDQGEFLMTVAGILTDQQFRAFLGQPKSEQQKLRYQLRQIRAEMALHGERKSLSRR